MPGVVEEEEAVKDFSPCLVRYGVVAFGNTNKDTEKIYNAVILLHAK